MANATEPSFSFAILDMQIELLKSKLHRVAVTAGNVNYEGSLTIPADLMARISLHPYERILCGNMANGARFETYAIPGPAGSKDFVLNGAVAHLGKVGDRLTIMSFAHVDEALAATWHPKVLVLNEKNDVVDTRGI